MTPKDLGKKISELESKLFPHQWEIFESGRSLLIRMSETVKLDDQRKTRLRNVCKVAASDTEKTAERVAVAEFIVFIRNNAKEIAGALRKVN